MNKEKKFHLRVRGVIRDGEHVLVARVKGCDYCFLPGGHHEVGESLADSLVREIREELAVSVMAKQYLGIVENGWLEGNTYQYEINHVFVAEISHLNAKTNPRAEENHLEFFWTTPANFARDNLLPIIIRPVLAHWFAGDNTIWQICNFE